MTANYQPESCQWVHHQSQSVVLHWWVLEYIAVILPAEGTSLVPLPYLSHFQPEDPCLSTAHHHCTDANEYIETAICCNAWTKWTKQKYPCYDSYQQFWHINGAHGGLVCLLPSRKEALPAGSTVIKAILSWKQRDINAKLKTFACGIQCRK